jgi:hypothetical protein
MALFSGDNLQIDGERPNESICQQSEGSAHKVRHSDQRSQPSGSPRRKKASHFQAPQQPFCSEIEDTIVRPLLRLFRDTS